MQKKVTCYGQKNVGRLAVIGAKIGAAPSPSDGEEEDEIPEEFIEDIDERHLSETLHDNITQFCQMVSSAAFKSEPLAMEKTNEIYELSRKIIHTRHRPVYRFRR